MNLRDRLALISFKINLKLYFTLKFIRIGFINAILLSIFIFLDFFSGEFRAYSGVFGTICAILGFYKLIKSNKITYFWSGFFVGIAWFYWISFSLIYYEFAYLIPLEIIGIGLFYAFIFLACGYFQNLFYRAIMLILINYIYPFGFNWLNFDLIFVNSPLAPNSQTLASFLSVILLYEFRAKFGNITYILGLILAIWLNLKPATIPNLLPFEVNLVSTNIAQDIKWDKKYLSEFVKNNFIAIDNAIKQKSRLIVFPESAFPMFLDHNISVARALIQKSHEIAILTGSLGYENGHSYNSAYLFENGEMKRLDKVVLVPFGEEIPMPKIFKKWISEVFFDGAKDFTAANAPSDYFIDGVKIRSAICYEATKDKIYEDLPKFVVAITNNAWFLPSTEPTLQRMLLKYFAYKYKTTIYHAINGGKSEIIAP